MRAGLATPHRPSRRTITVASRPGIGEFWDRLPTGNIRMLCVVTISAPRPASEAILRARVRAAMVQRGAAQQEGS
jgi:hypothetical protein